jgi:hypothetical protein
MLLTAVPCNPNAANASIAAVMRASRRSSEVDLCGVLVDRVGADETCAGVDGVGVARVVMGLARGSLSVG